jgi:hypothetical protein
MMQFFQQQALQTGIDSSLCQELLRSGVFDIEPKLFFTGEYSNPRGVP